MLYGSEVHVVAVCAACGLSHLEHHRTECLHSCAVPGCTEQGFVGPFKDAAAFVSTPADC